MTNLMRRLIVPILNIGADPNDDDDFRVRKILLVIVILIGITLAIPWAVLYFILGEITVTLILVCYATSLVISLLLFSQRRIRYDVVRRFQRILLLVMPFMVTLSLGGIVNSSAFIVWALVAPVGAAVFGDSIRVFLWWALAYLIVLIATALPLPMFPDTHQLSPDIIAVLLVMNLSGISCLVLIMIYYFARQRAVAFSLLRAEQEKSEGLLLNILPQEIAVLLKADGHTIANYHDGVSILFADIVGFTPMSAQMEPAQVVDLLNEVFSHIDTLVEKYNLEKIKTIGDCYMVAAGVPRPRSDHAQALTRLALDVREYVREHSFGGRRLIFRMGINSGPVIAGIIGRKKFIYDIWGDAANTASRMESQGVGGEIQITRATYELLKDQFICEPRGTLVVKGKGVMEVWYVVGEKQSIE